MSDRDLAEQFKKIFDDRIRLALDGSAGVFQTLDKEFMASLGATVGVLGQAGTDYNQVAAHILKAMQEWARKRGALTSQIAANAAGAFAAVAIELALEHVPDGDSIKQALLQAFPDVGFGPGRN